METIHPFEILSSIQQKIELMNKDRHIQALNILIKYPTITINEPKYGNVNVNLSRVPKEAIDDLLKFISYVEDQESALLMAEEQKRKYQNDFFVDDCSGVVESNVL